MIALMLLAVAAQQGASVPDPTGIASNALLQYGALGILTLMCVIAVVYLFRQVMGDRDRERARADRLETELTALRDAIQEKYLVVLGDATHAIAEALLVIRRGP